MYSKKFGFVKGAVTWFFSSFSSLWQLRILIRCSTWEIIYERQNHSFVPNTFFSQAKQKSNNRSNISKLWKTVRLTSFQKLQLVSVSIFFKFVLLCFLLYLLCCLILLWMFWPVIQASFTQFIGSSHSLNFEKFCHWFRYTALLN